MRCAWRGLSGLHHGKRGELYFVEPPVVSRHAQGRTETRMGARWLTRPGWLFRCEIARMTPGSLVSPMATARFVVTLPPEPSRIGEALRKDVAAAFTALTDTTDAFKHLATRAKERLVV